MQVRELHEKDKEEWARLLDQLNVEHHAFDWHWRTIFRKSFGHKARFLVAQDPRGLAILPLFSVRSALFGNSLISVPYLNAGGIVCDSVESEEAILKHADFLAESARADYLELRHGQEQVHPKGVDSTRSHKVTMVLEVPSDPEDLFSSFPPKLRSQIRRPTKSGLYAESLRGSEVTARHCDEFYAVFAEHMRDLGTPVYPKALFRNTLSCFGDRARLLLVKNNTKPVAVGITIGAGRRTEILWASSLRAYSKSAPNMLLYWEALKSAVQDGYQLFDFGRSSPDSGTFRFKKQWGAEAEELHWHYRLYQGELPDVNPNSPKYRFLVSCWKRMPLVLANTIGPYLTRGIP